MYQISYNKVIIVFVILYSPLLLMIIKARFESIIFLFPLIAFAVALVGSISTGIPLFLLIVPHYLLQVDWSNHLCLLLYLFWRLLLFLSVRSLLL